MKHLLTKNDKCKHVVDKINNLILNELKGVCETWVAGGAILSLIDNIDIYDIDLFFKNENELKYCLNYLKNKGGKVFFDGEKVIKVKYNQLFIDLVKIYYSTPKECVESFDFDICKSFIYKDNIDISRSYIAIRDNELSMSGKIKYPFSTLFRIQKYVKKGYSIDYRGCSVLFEAIKNGEIDEGDFYENNLA